VSPLLSDGRGNAVTRNDLGVIVERQELGANGPEYGAGVAAPKVGPAHAPSEERVASKKVRRLRIARDEAAAPRRVSRRVQNPEFDRARANHSTIYEPPVDVGYHRRSHSKELGLNRKHFVEQPIGLVDARHRARGSLELGGAAHVVEMGMRVHDRVDGDAERLQTRLDPLIASAGVYDDRPLCGEVGEDGAVAP
jgi:hypothetical protein